MIPYPCCQLEVPQLPDTQVCRDSSPESLATHSVKATVSETVIKLLKYQESLSQIYGTVYCVSISQKGLMTGCVYRRKNMCINVFRRMYVLGSGGKVSEQNINTCLMVRIYDSHS